MIVNPLLLLVSAIMVVIYASGGRLLLQGRVPCRPSFRKNTSLTLCCYYSSVKLSHYLCSVNIKFGHQFPPLFEERYRI